MICKFRKKFVCNFFRWGKYAYFVKYKVISCRFLNDFLNAGACRDSISRYKITKFNIVFYWLKFAFLYSYLFYPLDICKRHNKPRTTKFRSALLRVRPFWIYIFYPISVFYLRQAGNETTEGIPKRNPRESLQAYWVQQLLLTNINLVKQKNMGRIKGRNIAFHIVKKLFFFNFVLCFVLPC